ncbi:MAG: type II toxin-antitoxin system RelE/ParE family toxin [Gammaproteobacteria bacterium]|jgi:plasmid stabilization system protein ParE|nr:type II toxin-antitoxin system RelE/ParE family toxin [Gammaproteobacteria bacterium]MBT4077080.1 type II toxin-antitoxin system RelE/ParE family toxin [Gammaproteobacteria bacterium]MBT4193613.1 type II toxin-antitoxin system RelE/ParE family toxin [Gammaproteobacteria bacterium]MBT4452054.1 type II toxin-antitoxin system RelE/ParE family toxin [Gammaproteobacteria bacterium]MBT4862123.1 type II toxin-antitoxin system RelE/ParE family toxin [Gammaproteobacteria bacterium]
MKVSYTPESIGDLQRLREFIEIKNPQAAQRIAKSIIKGITQLKTLPLLGVEVDKAPNPEMVRDLIIGNYIVRYLVGSEINILRVWHHKEKRL